MSTKRKIAKPKSFYAEPKEIFDAKKMDLLTFAFVLLLCILCRSSPGGNLCMKVTSTRSTWQGLSRICKKAEDGIKIKSDAEFQVGLISKFKILRRAQHYYYPLMIKIPQRVKLLRLYIFQTRCP